MFLKKTHISTYSQVLMLHQDTRLLEPLGPRTQMIFRKGNVFNKNPKVLQCDHET